MAFTTRDLFREPLTESEIAELGRLAPGGVRALLSTRAAPYRALGLDRTARPEHELIALMAKEPRLLRRPLLRAGSRLVIGFDRAAFAEVR